MARRISVLSLMGFGELIRDGGELFFGEEALERPVRPLAMDR